MSNELKRYYVRRMFYLMEHPMCEICGAPAIEIHHKRGRGKWLNVTETWMAVDRACHTMIHDNPKIARENGWLISKFAK